MNRRETILLIRQNLVESYPLCFMPKGAPKKPLAIGIFKEIRRRKWPKVSFTVLNLVLENYTNGLRYYKALIEGADRVDLDGNKTGEVTWAEAKVASIYASYLEDAYKTEDKIERNLKLYQLRELREAGKGRTVMNQIHNE